MADDGKVVICDTMTITRIKMLQISKSLEDFDWTLCTHLVTLDTASLHVGGNRIECHRLVINVSY